MMKLLQLKLLVYKGRVVRILQWLLPRGFYPFNVLRSYDHTWQNTYVYIYIYILHLMVYLLYSSQ